MEMDAHFAKVPVMSQRKTLIYLTDGYPGDIYSEKVFVDSELEALGKRFSRIILVPCDKAPRDKRYYLSLPRGVEVDWSLTESRAVHSRILKLRRLFHLFTLQSLLMMTKEARTLHQWVKGLYQALGTLEIASSIRRIAGRHGLSPSDTMLYSMWFRNTGSAIALLSEREGWISATRAHSSDLYDHKVPFRSCGVRSRLLRSIGAVYVISRSGAAYMRDRFPESASRIKAFPLGSTRLYGPLPEEQRSVQPDEVAIVTVCRIIGIKRVGLTMDLLTAIAMKHPEKRIRWTVIGDGDEMDHIRRKACLARETVHNLKITLTGRKSNEEIQRLYASAPPDWFMLMSSTEGVPVSIGEAMSYGIPVIATDVGEVRELLTPECGLIVNTDFEPDDCAGRIAEILFNVEERRRLGRAAIRQWEAVFNSRVLSDHLASDIATLMSPPGNTCNGR